MAMTKTSAATTTARSCFSRPSNSRCARAPIVFEDSLESIARFREDENDTLHPSTARFANLLNLGEPSRTSDQSILVEMVNAVVRPGIFVCHLDITRHHGRTSSDFGIGKFETAARSRQRDMERFAGEFVDDRPASAFQNAWYFDPCGSEFEARLEIDRQEQRFAEVRAGGRENGEKI